MERCDVLIVGGGPGGSSCARRLVQSGADVLVLDKQRFPRDKTCAGWVTPPVLAVLDFDPDDYRRNAASANPAASPRVFQPITGFRTGIIGGDEVETHYDEPVSYGIRRCEFDHYLLERCGARLRLGEAFRSAEYADGVWRVNGEIEAKMLVGAGGHFCPIARRLGNRAGTHAANGAEPSNPEASDDFQPSVVAAQEIEFEVPVDELSRVHVAGNVPELFFCEDLQGYGWCFRKGNWLNIGLGRVDREKVSRHVAAFCDFLRERGKVACAIPPKFHGHAYQLYERVAPRLVDDGVLLVGDAAGLAYPQSGEGIRPAVESGLLAADAIVAAAGDYSRDRLAPYATRIAERFGPPRTSGAADWLPAAWLHYLAAKLLATRWFSKKVVLEKWFLHSATPALRLDPPSLMKGRDSPPEE
ncbi:MAG: NAD(P)/FAD-dependent oxidoreductase [Planctomycetaceae bacterium]